MGRSCWRYLVLNNYLKDGKDISDWFSFENDFICSIVSYFNNEPSPHYIEVLENSVLLEFSKSEIDALSDKYHDFERLIRIIVTEIILSHQKRIASILFHNAEQKYENLLKSIQTLPIEFL